MNVVIINITTKQKRKENANDTDKKNWQKRHQNHKQKETISKQKKSKIISAAETAVKGIAKIRTAISKESDDIISKNAKNSASCH